MVKQDRRNTERRYRRKQYLWVFGAHGYNIMQSSKFNLFIFIPENPCGLQFMMVLCGYLTCYAKGLVLNAGR